MNRVSDARDQAPQEIELAIGNLQNAIDLLGNVYNDVRDALNEFVANAYDDFVQGGIKDGVVIVKLLPKAKPPRIVVSDNGRGISREDLCRIVRNIANSSKRSGPTPSAEVIGEKGIGILGFQTLAEVCEIVTRHQASSKTFCLELRKGSTAALIREAERDRLLDISGTEVHLVGVDERTFRVLTVPKLAEYFARRWRKPLLQEAFRLQVAHGKNCEIVRPNRYEGEPLGRRVRTDLGHVEFELYIVPRSPARYRVSVLGAGGVEILADICQDPEFDHHPWCSDQVHGEVRFGLLRQTTGRRGLQHDRKVFPVFAAAVQAVEAELIRRIEQLNREHESSVDERLKRAISQAFRKALAELHTLSTTGLKVSIADPSGPEEQGRLFDNEAAAALDDAARTTEPGEGEVGGADGGGRTRGSPGDDHGEAGPKLEGPEEGPGRDVVDDEKGRVRQRPAVGLNYRPVAFEDTSRRSRYNEALRTIEINRIHPDYLRARDVDRRLFLDYMVALVAKELTLLNYEGIDPGELLERYVELLAKVQLHLPKRV